MSGTGVSDRRGRRGLPHSLERSRALERPTSAPQDKPVVAGRPRRRSPGGWTPSRGRGACALRSGLLFGPQRKASDYRLLLLFSIFLEFSPSPASLPCWLSRLLRKTQKRRSRSELRSGSVRAHTDAHSRWSVRSHGIRPGPLYLSDAEGCSPDAGSSLLGPPGSPLSRSGGFFLLVLAGFSAKTQGPRHGL